MLIFNEDAYARDARCPPPSRRFPTTRNDDGACAADISRYVFYCFALRGERRIKRRSFHADTYAGKYTHNFLRAISAHICWHWRYVALIAAAFHISRA